MSGLEAQIFRFFLGSPCLPRFGLFDDLGVAFIDRPNGKIPVTDMGGTTTVGTTEIQA